MKLAPEKRDRPVVADVERRQAKPVDGRDRAEDRVRDRVADAGRPGHDGALELRTAASRRPITSLDPGGDADG